MSALPGSDEDASQTSSLAREYAAAWLVVDGYQFGVNYQRAVMSSTCPLLFVDDYGHTGRYVADVVLDQNLSAVETDYEQRELHTHLLLGPRYSLLRREFNRWQGWEREIAPIGHRVLLTMGGSDPGNFSQKAVAALQLIAQEDDEFKAIVVLGGSREGAEQIEALDPGIGAKIEVRRDISNMNEVMAWADIAISAAGTTCWELCLLGLPAVLIDLAENQIPVAQELSHRGCAVHLGSAQDVSPQSLAQRARSLLKSQKDREAISSRCRRLVDGRGAKRVAAALNRGRVRLRPARESDCRLFWEWVNDPQVRAAAFCSAPISWEHHRDWFMSRIADPKCRILVAEEGTGRPIGQFRLDWRSPDEADADVIVSKDQRGLGYGSVLIDLAVNHAFAERSTARIHAFVKPENQASRRSFELARFENLGEQTVLGHVAIHYLRKKSAS